MPLFSFVVIAYNVSTYIEACLTSLKKQKGVDYEIIVVNDASTDNTLDVIRACAEGDARFHIIDKQINGGAHLARRDGVLASKGQFVVFVDGDDELSPVFCELMAPYVLAHKTDMLRFGRRVISTRAENDASAAASERMFNVPLPETQENEHILSWIFSDMHQPRLTWSIIDMVFCGDFVRKRFQEMTADRLGRMEDSYEMFMLCAKAQKFGTVTDFQGLHYNFGNGCSGNTLETPEQFIAMQASAKQLDDCIARFAVSTSSRETERCAQWLHEEYVRIVGNDWVVRLNEEDQQDTIGNVAETWGIDVAYQILTDTLCARAKWLVDRNEIPERSDEFYRWLAMLTKLESEHVRDSGLADKREQVHKYEWHFHDEKSRREREEKLRREQAEQERLRRIELEKEAYRRFKKGTLMRRLTDACLPENSIRRDVVSVIIEHRRSRRK